MDMKCSCGYTLAPVYFYDQDKNRPGYAKLSCSHLLCDNCGAKTIVDDTFDQQSFLKWTDVQKKY